MTNRRLFLFASLTAACAGAATLWSRAPASGAEPAFDGEPEVVAATFASAWCASCKILQPKLARVIPAFAHAPIAFVDFDFTFGARAEVKETAEKFGLGDLYERNKGATGFTVLVDADTGAILDTLTMNFSEDAMRSAIARALALASSTDDPSGAENVLTR